MNSTFNITINTAETGPLTIREREDDIKRSNFDEEFVSDETLALVMAALAAAKATGESVTINTSPDRGVTVAPVAPLFYEEFIAWSKRRSGHGFRVAQSHRGEVLQDVRAVMPTLVFEHTDYDGVVRRITVDAEASITSYDGERREHVYLRRTFTVERRGKDGTWRSARKWTPANCGLILDVVEDHCYGGEDILSLRWASLFNAFYDFNHGYFDAIHEHGPSQIDRDHACAVRTSLTSLREHLDGALVEWEVQG